MMLLTRVLLLLGCCNALRLSPSVSRRSGSVSMGLDVGGQFPASALRSFGVYGKNAVVFFYGADDAPSCSKEISGFEDKLDEFKAAGVSAVGVRNGAGDKDIDTAVTLVVDEGDAVRSEIGIEKDLFGLLGGRETYVVDSMGAPAISTPATLAL